MSWSTMDREGKEVNGEKTQLEKDLISTEWRSSLKLRAERSEGGEGDGNGGWISTEGGGAQRNNKEKKKRVDMMQSQQVMEVKRKKIKAGKGRSSTNDSQVVK